MEIVILQTSAPNSKVCSDKTNTKEEEGKEKNMTTKELRDGQNYRRKIGKRHEEIKGLARGHKDRR